jgi:hypothetical protein
MSNSHQDRSESRLSLHREEKRKFPRGRILKAAVASFAAWTMILPGLALAAVAKVKGSAVATITVNFKVAPPSGSTVSCSLELISSDQLGPSDTNSVTATVSGSTATCNITMYYKWRLMTPSTDTLTVAYSVQGPIQTSTALYDIITQPADGTVTTLTIGVIQ